MNYFGKYYIFLLILTWICIVILLNYEQNDFLIKNKWEVIEREREK